MRTISSDDISKTIIRGSDLKTYEKNDNYDDLYELLNSIHRSQDQVLLSIIFLGGQV